MYVYSGSYYEYIEISVIKGINLDRHLLWFDRKVDIYYNVFRFLQPPMLKEKDHGTLSNMLLIHEIHRISTDMYAYIFVNLV